MLVICLNYLSEPNAMSWNRSPTWSLLANCLVTSLVSCQRFIDSKGHKGQRAGWGVVLNIPEYRSDEDSFGGGWRSYKLEKKRNYQWRMPNVQTFLTGSPLKRFSVPNSLVAGPEIFWLQYLDALKQCWSFIE